MTVEELALQAQKDERQYLTLSLAPERVVFVKDLVGLKLAETVLGIGSSNEGAASQSTVQYVGLDSEWSSRADVTGASILQVSTTSHVFIFDVAYAQARDPRAQRTRWLLTELFQRPDIIKLGKCVTVS